jgi:hypothetical protein
MEWLLYVHQKVEACGHQEMKMDQKSGIFTSLSAAVYF